MNPAFLSDILILFTSLLAFAIPLSYHLIGRIADRYSRPQIAHRFRKESALAPLVYLSIVCIPTVIVARSLSASEQQNSSWNALLWIALILTVAVALVCVIQFYRAVLMYLLDPHKVLMKSLELIHNRFTKNKDASDSDFLIASDVMSKDMNWLGLSVVRTSLEKLRALAREHMITSKKPSQGDRPVPGDSILSLFREVHRSAVDQRNSEISWQVSYNVVCLLAEMANDWDHRGWVETIGDTRKHLAVYAMEHADASAHSVGYHWYVDIVFWRLGKSPARGADQAEFDVQFLEQFDKELLATLRYAIAHEKDDFFQAFVAFSFDSVPDPEVQADTTIDALAVRYHSVAAYGFSHQFSELQRAVKRIGSLEELNERRKRFIDLCDRLAERDDQEALAFFEEKRNEALAYIEAQYKFNGFRAVIFSTGAYCLFKRRYDLIRYMWEYKQPPDADAHWAAADIVPTKPHDVLQFYTSESLQSPLSPYNFREGHHGTEAYFGRYCILLLAWCWQRQKVEETVRGILPDIAYERLGSVKYYCDKLISEAQILKSDQQARGQLGQLGFKADELDDLLDKKVIASLEKTKEQAKEKLSQIEQKYPLSNKRFQAFEAIVSKQLGLDPVRAVFEAAGKWQLKSADNGELKPYFFHCDRAAFLDDWPTDYDSRWEHMINRKILPEHRKDVLSPVLRQCEEVLTADLDSVVGRFKEKESLVILCLNTHAGLLMRQGLLRRDRFVFKGGLPSGTAVSPAELHAVTEAVYIDGELEIPLIRVSVAQRERQVVIVDINTLGTLDYSPSPESETKSGHTFIVEPFRVDIREYKDHPDLVEKRTAGIEDSQKKEIQERLTKYQVDIEFSARFKYSPSDSFRGYLIPISEEPD